MIRTHTTAGSRTGRWSGACLIAAGLLLLSTAPHPDVFETTFGDAAVDTPFWTAMHAALLGSSVLSLYALLGIHRHHGDRLGRLGTVGVGLSVPGLVLAACAFSFEAFQMPVIARQSPALLAWDGAVVRSWGTGVAALAGLWLVGFCVLGIALYRAGVVPRAAALTLAISSVAFALLEGPFVPVLGVLSTIAFAAGHVWVGAALWFGTGRAGAAAPARRRRTPVPTGHG